MDSGTAGNRWVPSSTGTFTVTAVTDDINRFPESDENNNTRSAQVTVGGAPQPQAGVVVTEVSWTPAQPEAGQAVQFHARVVNQGTAVTGGIVGVGFGVGVYYGWGFRAPMQPGETALISMTGGPSNGRWFPPSTGSLQVTANVDDINRFPESDEGNNTRQAMVTVGGGGGPGPVGPNKFGIGMAGYGNSTLYDRARDLVGEGGWVLAICPEITLANTGASEDCKGAVREITTRGQNVIVRLAPPWGNQMICHDADPGSNRLRYPLFAAKYKMVVEQLLAAMGGPQRKLVAQTGNELNLCYEWESSEEYEWTTMAHEVAAFQRDVADALQTLTDSRLVVVCAPLAPGGAGRCVPVGDASPGATHPRTSSRRW
ncbi:CARDB domain-containing protein [Hyalangium versicolor]|uniref:CARDB domain-containing protein n=1 Tax=Hyalangium versicolor TaxID=2861190 RepID=UPI001CCF33B2|nr:CARDB domain-containing protein [Hyalangium versicolor]